MNSRALGALRPQITRSAKRALVSTVTAAMATVGLSGLATAPAHSAQASTALTSARAMALAPSTYEKRVQRVVNNRRAAHGLVRLRMAPCPDGTAQRWADHLAANDAFYHQSMSAVLDRCNARYAGETLGRGSMTPRKLVRMWMQSPGHRAILLSHKPRRIGIGVSPDGTGRVVVAANFVRF